MEMKSCCTSNDAREALRTLPKTLEKTYDRILGMIPKRSQSYVQAALQWIACSARPLSPNELAVVAVIDPAVAKRNGSGNQLIEAGQTIHKLLSKLIDVREIQRDVFRRSGSDSIIGVLKDLERRSKEVEYPPEVVSFSHSSVRDYLLQRDDDANTSSPFCFSEDMAHRFIAKSCLALIKIITDKECDGDEAYHEGRIFLQNYLASHWHTHAARLPDEEPGSLAYLINEVPEAVLFLLQAEDEYSDDSFQKLLGFDESKKEPPSPQHKLQYAACSGSSCIVDIMLTSHPDLDVDAVTDNGATALSLACERGHWQIADRLLRQGADPNKHDEMTAPLLHASRHGANDIVQQLISHGADVNVFCEGEEGTPLTAAIAACHLSTVNLLLLNRADPNLISGSGVSLAAESGRHECMDILLKHASSLKLWDIDEPSLLEHACVSGSIETVRLLLKQGLNIDDRNRLLPLNMDKLTPTTTYRFRYPIVEIRPPASWSAHWSCYGSPMHAAAAYGHTEIVKLLVEKNAAVNEKSHYWHTPSTLARVRGHKETLEYLLSVGGETSEETDVCYRRDLFSGDCEDKDSVCYRRGFFCDNCEDEDSICRHRGTIMDRESDAAR